MVALLQTRPVAAVLILHLPLLLQTHIQPQSILGALAVFILLLVLV